jgi:hypothetical protein
VTSEGKGGESVAMAVCIGIWGDGEILGEGKDWVLATEFVGCMGGLLLVERDWGSGNVCC